MSDHAALIEEIKDFATDHDLARVAATIRTGPDTWTIVRVAEASGHSDSKDGWDTTVEDGGM